MKIKKIFYYFTKTEITLWSCSIALIITSFFIFKSESYLTLFSSIIGTTSLIFNAKGHPLGQLFMVVFSIFYGIISYSFSYYGEMITYLGMTMPISILAFISWLRNPYEKNKSEVKVNSLNTKETIYMWILTVFTTVCFYFILKYCNTSNLILSTLSITTSFLAAYLSYKRSPYFAVAYACNDVVLISLWFFASIENTQYISVVVCFISFLANDIYGYINWMKLRKRQSR